MYEISERWSDDHISEYLAVNRIPYEIKIVWRGGRNFTTLYNVDLRDEDALYLTLAYSDVVATKLDK